MAPVEIATAIFVAWVVDAQERWIPAIPAKNLIRTLAALHDLDVLGYFFRQKIEGDGVMADHGLRHRLDRTRQCREGSARLDADLLVIGSELLGDDIRVTEFVAGVLVN